MSAAVYLREGRGRSAISLDQGTLRDTVVGPARDQARQLSAAVACGPPQVGQHHAALALVALRVVKPRQHAADVLVALVVTPTADLTRCERHFGRCAEKLLQLLNRAQPSLVHVDHHSRDDQLTRPPVRLRWCALRLISRWKHARRSGSYLVGQGCSCQRLELKLYTGRLSWIRLGKVGWLLPSFLAGFSCENRPASPASAHVGPRGCGPAVLSRFARQLGGSTSSSKGSVGTHQANAAWGSNPERCVPLASGALFERPS